MRGAPSTKPSGRFLLRIGPGLHGLLRKAAADLGISLNDYCSLKLAAPAGNLPALRQAAAVVARAAELFGDRLIGIAAYGSWARGEAAAGSDVDLLVVLEGDVRLTRRLYRRWDRVELRWNDREIEVHFAHLPDPDRPVAGLWAEVAMDGVVLFERELRLSARLVGVRRDIASGRLVRRLVHGQPYWTEVA